MAVGRGKAHSDELLRGKAVEELSAADRNLATALVLGVLRWQIWLDEQVKRFLKKPRAKLDAEAAVALRLGAFQLLFLDRIPAHAAIDESVELTKQSGHRFASSMVNAVLRKLWSERAAATELSQASSVGAHPGWMVDRWTGFYGADAAQAICRHGQAQPRLTVRVVNKAIATELARAGVQLEPGELMTAARAVSSGDIPATAAFREGRVRIQDEASQLIGELAARAGNDCGEKVRTIVDLCAAPGGKTLILAERNPETRIVACEASSRRLDEMRVRLVACGDRLECRLADAAALKEESVFDVALADVPCSGTGTLGRNPEIRHRLRPEDLMRYAERQRAILRAALRTVRIGGRVVYSTCSLELEENDTVVASMLAEDPKGRQISLAESIEDLLRDGILTGGGAARLKQCLTHQGALRLLPGALPTDGFFVALFERIA